MAVSEVRKKRSQRKTLTNLVLSNRSLAREERRRRKRRRKQQEKAQQEVYIKKRFFFFFFFFCVPQLYLWGSPLLGEIFAYVAGCVFVAGIHPSRT